MFFSDINEYKKYLKAISKTPPFIIYMISFVIFIIWSTLKNYNHELDIPLSVKQLFTVFILLNSLWGLYYSYKIKKYIHQN